MINITNKIIKKQNNFWNHCLFHPTDAVEDPWGKRILDRMAKDGAVKTIRIYAMLEDIVYTDENGKLLYDFRLSDLRLDYLVEKGFCLLLAYGGVPDCVASSNENKTSMSKNKTRYKGKMWNTSPPKDMNQWEDICFEYTNHLVERYGIERVSTWRCQCFNEPDGHFFFGHLPREDYKPRLKAYCKMYEAFERGIRRVSDRIRIGGPATTSAVSNLVFLDGFLTYVREKSLKLDYIALHNYGSSPAHLSDGERPLTVRNTLKKHEDMLGVIKQNGFEGIEVILDEWGSASGGFINCEKFPELLFRETEVFSAYYVKLIAQMIKNGYEPYKMMICLSGQHEMTADFTGFRNFFTMNFIQKPIYSAYLLASKLKENLVESTHENTFVSLVPTKSEDGTYSLLLTYTSEYFKEDIPTVNETLSFKEDVRGRCVSVWCIDRDTANPYRMYEKMHAETLTEEQITLLREEGRVKPVSQLVSDGTPISIKLTPNCVYLITVD